VVQADPGEAGDQDEAKDDLESDDWVLLWGVASPVGTLGEVAVLDRWEVDEARERARDQADPEHRERQSAKQIVAAAAVAVELPAVAASSHVGPAPVAAEPVVAEPPAELAGAEPAGLALAPGFAADAAVVVA
jgi:hypothetical protein